MKLIYTLLFLLLASNVNSQKITYAKAGNPDVHFEILGNVGGYYHVFETERAKRKLIVYDSDLAKLDQHNYSFLNYPSNKRAAIIYPKHVLIIYEVREKNVIHCKAVKLGPLGQTMGEPVLLDTASEMPGRVDVAFEITFSGDKNTILISKTLSYHGKQDEFFKLLDANLNLIDQYQVQPSGDQNVIWSSSPLVANNGTVVSLRSYTAVNTHSEKLQLLVRSPKDRTPVAVDVPINGRTLKDLVIGIDNQGDRYYLTSLFKESDGNVKGIFAADVDAKELSSVRTVFNFFSEALRGTINPGVQPLTAFNELRIHSIDAKVNGAVTATLEDRTKQHYQRDSYSASRYDPFAPPREAYHPSYRDYDFVRNETFMTARTSGQVVLAQNIYRSIVVVEIDSSLTLTWNSIINKNQVDERFSSFGSVNAGVEKFYLFSSYKAPAVVNHYGILPDGEFKKYNTFKTLQSGHNLMLRYLHQVGPRQILVPTQYRNRTGLALIDFTKPYDSSE